MLPIAVATLGARLAGGWCDAAIASRCEELIDEPADASHRASHRVRARRRRGSGIHDIQLALARGPACFSREEIR